MRSFCRYLVVCALPIAFFGCEDTPNTPTSTSSGSSTSSSGEVGGMGGAGGAIFGGAGGAGGIIEECFPEKCNGIDDNCDGAIDNGNPGGGEPCMTGLPGECNLGKTSCSNGNLICTPDVGPGLVEETCNGVDDDCDGVIDENILGVGMACDTGSLGPCAAGKRACTNGMLTCESTVVPSAEVLDGIDNDCDGMIDDGLAPGQGLWSKGFGNDSDDQFGYRIASDAQGNVAIVGNYNGSVDFGGGNFTTSNNQELFLAKLDPSGGHVWSRVFLSGGAAGFAEALAFDSTGNLYTAGYILSITTINGTTLNPYGLGDIFITKHDPAGGLLWSKVIGEGTSTQMAYDLVATPLGGVVITGTISAAVDFGSGELNGDQYDAFLAAYDAAGTHLFSKRFGDADFQHGKGVAVNAAGEIVLAVHLQGSANFGGDLLTASDDADVAIAKFSADGTPIWSKVFSSAAHQEVNNVAFDPSGNIIFAGITTGTINFGCGPAAPPKSLGFYVQKLDSNGSCIWTKVYGTANTGSLIRPRLAVDPNGNILVVGHFVDILDLGAGPMTAVQNSFDVFVLKLNPMGNHVWSKQYGDPAAFAKDRCYDIASDPVGNILAIGDYGSTIDFGFGVMTTGDAITQDVWVAKLSP